MPVDLFSRLATLFGSTDASFNTFLLDRTGHAINTQLGTLFRRSQGLFLGPSEDEGPP